MRGPETESGATLELTVDLGAGRLRRRQTWLLLALTIGAVWFWAGAVGSTAILVAVAAWRLGRRPLPPGPQLLQLDARAVRTARMDRWRVLIPAGNHTQEIFRDELSNADWAALRRYIKTRGAA